MCQKVLLSSCLLLWKHLLIWIFYRKPHRNSHPPPKSIASLPSLGPIEWHKWNYSSCDTDPLKDLSLESSSCGNTGTTTSGTLGGGGLNNSQLGGEGGRANAAAAQSTFLFITAIPLSSAFSEPFQAALWIRNYFLRFRFRFRLLKSYGSGFGSGSYFLKVMVPVPVPTFEKLRFRFRFQRHI